MRKLALLLVVALVVAYAAPAVAKQVVVSRGSSMLIRVPSMEADAAYAYVSDSEEGIDISDYHEEFVCTEANADPKRVSINGWSEDLDDFDVSPTKGKDKFTSGYARATFEWGTYSYELCDGTQVVDGNLAEGATITMELDGTDGRLVRSKLSDREGWSPPEYIWHERSRSLMRTAKATVMVSVGDWSFEWRGYGEIGKARSWQLSNQEN